MKGQEVLEWQATHIQGRVRMKSEARCCKETEARMFQNYSAAMSVMTQSTHTVVVFLLVPGRLPRCPARLIAVDTETIPNLGIQL